MDTTRAKELLAALADGVDPYTGEFSPEITSATSLKSSALCTRQSICSLPRQRNTRPATPGNPGPRSRKKNCWMNLPPD